MDIELLKIETSLSILKLNISPTSDHAKFIKSLNFRLFCVLASLWVMFPVRNINLYKDKYVLPFIINVSVSDLLVLSPFPGCLFRVKTVNLYSDCSFRFPTKACPCFL